MILLSGYKIHIIFIDISLYRNAVFEQLPLQISTTYHWIQDKIQQALTKRRECIYKALFSMCLKQDI